MRKHLPTILIYFFLLVFIIQIACLVALLVIPQPGQAADFTPQVSIPGSKFEKGGNVTVSGSTKTIGDYIKAIYNYSIGIVGILATVVLMFGGVMWITAGGNTERVGSAKAWIGAALTGLVLTLCSYVILNTVNPDLVNLKVRTIAPAEPANKGCCLKDGVATDGKTKSQCDKDGGSWGGEGTIKYHQANKADKCLTQSELEALQFCCIRTETKGNNTIISCSDKTKSECQFSKEPGVTQISIAGKCSSYPDKCQSSSDCTGKAAGDQCGENKICKSISGTLKCEPCSPILLTCGGGSPNAIDCCTYDNLTCGPSKFCISNLISNCVGKSDGTSCKTSTGQNGYCENDKCNPCIAKGSACLHSILDYECVGASGLCGSSNAGDCNGSIIGTCPCTCK